MWQNDFIEYIKNGRNLKFYLQLLNGFSDELLFGTWINRVCLSGKSSLSFIL